MAMINNKIDWTKKHIVKINNEFFVFNDLNESEVKSYDWRKKIEPWLTAIFQSEHFSLLTGTGLTTAISALVGCTSQGMNRIEFNTYKEEINLWAENSAQEMGRGEANIEDDVRTALELLKGLYILKKDRRANSLKKEIDRKLLDFVKNILKTEYEFYSNKDSFKALNYLKSFLISFASRTATRDRLQIFTTNYDRFIEYGCDMAGILILDRFIGKIKPIFRASKLELDYHYNPPGIRGEPRYVEGVARLTKLHGSIDWRFQDGQIVKAALPFGATDNHPEIPEKASEHLVIYPNSSKGIDTAFYPYAELFRDFASAICRPNSVIVTYGYGFGDSHINRILKDMLTIPSTHIVIISYDNLLQSKASRIRIQKFVEENNIAQFTLLIGCHFGDLKLLVDDYLPKAAIDRLSNSFQKIKEKREIVDSDRETKKEVAVSNDEQ